MRLIIVTRKIDGARMYINPEYICAVYPYYYNNNGGATVIQFPGDENNYLEVSESADTVARMIWRASDDES